jgi:hypothetical protein
VGSNKKEPFTTEDLGTTTTKGPVSEQKWEGIGLNIANFRKRSSEESTLTTEE